MSRGYGGYADLLETNDKYYKYKYCCYNVNNSDWKLHEKLEDGVFLIERSNIQLGEVTNASGAWMFDDDGTDIMTYRLYYEIYKLYEADGHMPRHIGFYC